MSLSSTDPDDLTGSADEPSIRKAYLGGAGDRQGLLVPSVRSAPSTHPDSVKLVGSVLERTLLRLLGPGAPLELLLEKALLEALGAWPTCDGALLLWGQRLAVRAASEYLKQAGPSSSDERRTTRPGRAREVLEHLQVWLRQARPDEQLAFTLLELNGSSIGEAAVLLGAPTAVVRQRAARVRRQLLFAARRDLWLTRYLLIAPRLRALLRSWDRAALKAPPSERTRRISAAVQLELTWFV